jgi:DNA polymerase type B, organellar and viral
MKILLTIILVAIALLSVIILITFKHLNNLILFITFSLNIISLYLMIFYIQSIGWNISTISLWFLISILLNNIFLSLIRFIINNLSSTFKIKQYLIQILSVYIKIFYLHPNYIIRKTFSIGNEMLNIFNNRVNNLLYDLLVIEPLKLISKKCDSKNKSTIFTFENNRLLDHKNLFLALFVSLSSQDEFSKQGKKIMIVSISTEDKTFYIHKNIIIDENTTIYDYLEKIKNNIQTFYESGYPISTFNILEIKLWNYEINTLKKGSNKISTNNSIHKFRRSIHTSCINNKNTNLNLIKPLKTPQSISKLSIGAIDIETIEFNNNQLPISISFSYNKNNQIFTIFKLIDYDLLKTDSNQAVKLLWLNFMDELNELKLHKCVIFSHNLGSFDGYFIFKGLLELPEIDISKVNSIIDDFHKFISIEIFWKDSKFIFKDSLRIFPVSLQQLCSLFGVEGKSHPYNPLFNKLSLFENNNLLTQFIEYSKQDSISLLKALLKAQNIYVNEHEVDIATIWSTSTLSLKIFRQKFLDIDIPILSNKLDNIIRLSYIGGSTDYFYQYGENLKHYDVNSLYPKAMCNPMPLKFLGEIEGDNVRLENVFGFAEARISTPHDMEIPLLPLKVENETLHPLGSWIGVYFTEELKTIVKYGYKVELIKVYSFSKSNIFNNYISFFYNIKKNSVGPLRFIAKMHLNQLYGYFGRRKTLIETRNVHNEDLIKYYGSYTIFSEIKINENITTILMSSNLDYNLINEIKNYTNLNLTSSFRNVKSHVGIASAVTSYARIEMMELKMLLLKLGIKLYYTDTDSIFTDKEIPNYLIGKDLGQLKDELNGKFIKKAYFLGIKKYGYVDSDNNIHSIFSGIERDSLTWNEIEEIAKGFTIVKTSPIRFYKNFDNLNIIIKNQLKTSIIFNPRKKMFNNKYLPIIINVNFMTKIHYYLKIIKNRIIFFIKKYDLNKIK